MRVDMAALNRLIAAELDQPVAPDVAVLSDRIRRDRPEVLAVLFYGAGLWKPPAADTVFDFYVLTQRYRDFDPRRLHAVLGWLLPPNVYYLAYRELRCKYAVMRMDQFGRAASGRSLHTQVWARFAQPSRLVYARDPAARDAVTATLADAVITFHAQTLPLLGDGGTRARDVWFRGLGQTYGNEWRSESSDRVATIYAASRDALEARSRLVLPGCAPAAAVATRGIRRWAAKTIYFLQMMKAVFTFEGGVDYALWKIERQSGVRLDATDFQKRHPLISAWPLVWRAWKAGALR